MCFTAVRRFDPVHYIKDGGVQNTSQLLITHSPGHFALEPTRSPHPADRTLEGTVSQTLVVYKKETLHRVRQTGTRSHFGKTFKGVQLLFYKHTRGEAHLNIHIVNIKHTAES